MAQSCDDPKRQWLEDLNGSSFDSGSGRQGEGGRPRENRRTEEEGTVPVGTVSTEKQPPAGGDSLSSPGGYGDGAAKGDENFGAEYLGEEEAGIREGNPAVKSPYTEAESNAEYMRRGYGGEGYQPKIDVDVGVHRATGTEGPTMAGGALEEMKKYDEYGMLKQVKEEGEKGNGTTGKNKGGGVVEKIKEVVKGKTRGHGGENDEGERCEPQGKEGVMDKIKNKLTY